MIKYHLRFPFGTCLQNIFHTAQHLLKVQFKKEKVRLLRRIAVGLTGLMDTNISNPSTNTEHWMWEITDFFTDPNRFLFTLPYEFLILIIVLIARLAQPVPNLSPIQKTFSIFTFLDCSVREELNCLGVSRSGIFSF